mgnify:FL=1
MTARFSKEELNGLIIEDLGDRVVWSSGINSKTLLLDLEMPKRKLRIYVFNCTCPPGGRALDEYKIQMIIEGQSRGERGHINMNDGRIPLIMGYACPFDDDKDGVYIIWDTNFHMEFAYSANLQCYLDPMLQALSEDVVTCYKKGNREQIVVARRENLTKAIERRIQLDIQNLLG